MYFSLYQKLAWSLVSIFLLIAALVYFSSTALEQSTQHRAEQNLHLQLAEHLVQDNPLLKEGIYDYQALENLFHTLMLLGPAFEFYFIDEKGKILTYSAKPGEVKRQHIRLAPLLTLMRQPNNTPIYGDDPRHLHKEKIFSAAPVYNKQQLQGYLYVIIGSSAYDTRLEQLQGNQTLWLTLMWLGAGFVFLLLSLLLLFRYFTAPLKRLARNVSQVEAADYQLKAIQLGSYPDKNNEVDQLGRSINTMLTKINEQFSSLKQAQQQRSELLTHLSHDLRSPLASLHGFIDIVANQAHPLSIQERQHYLAMSLSQCHKLKHLIEQIFELANLQAGQIKLHSETFNLGELIYDCVLKFHPAAKEKQIQLIVKPTICDFTVVSDIAKLERVLSNLIDNALCHTPAGGTITIMVSPQPDQSLIVDIADTGIGIKEDELTTIFEPHYRASNSNNSKNKQGGLGLAICKALLQLMGSDISVTSELGKGTQFRFKLTTQINT